MIEIDRSTPPKPGPVRTFEFPPVRRRALTNGLDVLAAPHGDLPIVTVALVARAGAAEEPRAKAGVARLTAHALETGAGDRQADELAWALERLGAELSTDAGWDSAIVQVTVPRERLEPTLDIFADIVRRPTFPEREVARLRDEQLAEILQRRKEPRALASDAAAHFIFRPETPYSRPVIGLGETVEGLGREDVEAFYRAMYVPSRCAVLLVGDLDADDARDAVENRFGSWTGQPSPLVEFAVEGAAERTTIHLVDRPDAVQSEIRIGQVGVERHHPDYFALLVMNEILGGAFTSRLNMSLREKHGFTYGARSAFAFRRRPGPFAVQAAVATDVTARAVEEALREMRQLRDEGATDAEVANARDYLAGVMPLDLQTTGQLAGRLADLVVYELPDEYFESYRARIAAVSAEDVRRAAREHLRLERLSIVVVGAASAIREPLEALGAGPVEVHSLG